MQLIKRVIQTAKERAQIKFLALTRLMVKEAEASIVQLLADQKPGLDKKAANLALMFLRNESAGFINRMETLFRGSVDRAMRTMYNDLRHVNTVSIDNLSLVDDETVIKQLEVGNLVQRLRDACDQSLGRLNIMIAQAHGDPDVHERENPFRPYLIARALYDVLRERMPQEEVARLLFEHLADSLARHLSEFYASICDVFDSSGIQARLMARPTKMKQHQRDFLARQLAEINSKSTKGGGIGGIIGPSFGTVQAPSASHFNERVMPTLQRMQDLMQRSSGGGRSAGFGADAGEDFPSSAQPGELEDFQDLIWRMFSPPVTESDPNTTTLGNETAPVGRSAAAEGTSLPPVSAALLAEVQKYQQLAAENDRVDGNKAPRPDQIYALGDKLTPATATPMERVAVDLIAVLFEFILDDEQIPAQIRLQIGRLQIPFLKAAMLSPDLLQDADHPARQLLNRMGSATVGVDPQAPMGKKLSAEIDRIVKKILVDFSTDVEIFSASLQELEAFLAEQLCKADEETARSVEAVEEAERASVMLVNTAASLRDILLPLNIDKRVVDFMLQIWARVLVRASLQDKKGGAASRIADQYRDVLPELTWSAQEKQTVEDRSTLIRLLPSLVKRLRFGMLMIHMPEEECKNALDGLVEMHTQVLRPNQTVSSVKLPTLDELRQQFSRLVISEGDATWTVAEATQVQEEVVETLLADKGAEAELALDRPSKTSDISDAEWLSLIQLGTCVQVWAADTHVNARAIWVSRHRSLFIFKMDKGGKPLVYSAASLIKALHEGTIRLLEYAPAFDRAVDSLLLGAEQVAKR
jgi:hypothetical protein